MQTATLLRLHCPCSCPISEQGRLVFRTTSATTRIVAIYRSSIISASVLLMTIAGVLRRRRTWRWRSATHSWNRCRGTSSHLFLSAEIAIACEVACTTAIVTCAFLGSKTHARFRRSWRTHWRTKLRLNAGCFHFPYDLVDHILL